jgi:hypothetical protein
MNNFAELSDGDNAQFLVRWRGRQEGPYRASVIETKLAANEIGLLHEIFYKGKWVAIRDYITEREAVLRAEHQAREDQERRVREEADREVKAHEERRSVTPQDETNNLVRSPARPSAQAPLCRTCGLGSLVKLNQYRLSLPVVVIGYFLLVPSAIGMLFSIFGLVSYMISGGAVISQSAAPDKEVAVMAAMFGSGFFIFLLVMSFIGGIFGWLLIMKKKVLQCTHCGAVVAAS